jgi:hypothetical protein
MKKFSFDYEAVKYKHFTIKVRAKSIEEAIKLADKKAGEKRFLNAHNELHRIGLEDDKAKEDL